MENTKYEIGIIRDNTGDRLASERARQAALRRLQKRTLIDDQSGCWLWRGASYPSGYGQMTFFKQHIAAHRLSYMAHKGRIPMGLVLDHLCRARACVNPEHLEPVTQQENLSRGIGISTQHARRTHCNHGHPFDGGNVGISDEGYRYCMECKRIQARARYRQRVASVFAEAVPS